MITKVWAQKVVGLFALTIFVTSALITLVPSKAFAAGESLRWTANSTIEMSGGDLASPGQFTSNTPAGTSFFGTFAHESGCNIRLQLILSAGSTNGVLSVPAGTGGGTNVPNPCSGDIANTYRGQAVTIQGPRPGPGDAEETPLQKNVHVKVNSSQPASASPDSITMTFKNAAGQVIGTIGAEQTSADTNPNEAGRVVYYENGIRLEPGNYSVCFSAIITQCQNFTKEKYVQKNLEYGTPLTSRRIYVEVSAVYTGPPEQLFLGPISLALNKAGAQVANIQTNTTSHNPGSESGNQRITLTVKAQFEHIGAGAHQVCIISINRCANVPDTKFDYTVKFTIDGADAQRLFAAGANDDEEKPVCEVSSSPMSWLLCPIYNGLATMSDWIILNVVVPFMRPTPVGLDPNDKYTGATFQIWSAFRVYGNIVLVVLLLIAVFGQAIGGGLVEAYTARKMLPRILIAGVFINISIYVVAFAVDLSVIIGNGIADLITQPLVQTGEFTFNPSTTQAFAISGIAATLVAITTFLISTGTLGAIVPFLLLFLVLPVFLAIVVIFVTLIILQATIMGLVIVSPVAFALYCLPNTERYFNLWWDWLFRALLVYPFFMTIVGISDVFTVMIQRANGVAG
jgi:hypothetical protein